jgi:acyl transferase domain-containing protein
MHLHPLLHENISTLSAQRFCSTLTGTEFFLRDHQVQGQKVLPGVAYLEMVQAALSQSLDGLSKSKAHIALMNVVWVRPLTVNGPTKITIGLFPAENGEIGYEIYTDNAEDGNPVTHSQGVALLSSSDTLKLNLADLQIKLNRSQIDRQACYETFASMGLNYGPTHQGIERIYVGEKEVLAKISLPLVLEKTKNEFFLHPTLLDAALQASIGLSFNEEKRQLSLPLALERLDILNACTESMWAWVRYAAGGVASDKVQKLDIDLCDEDGLVCIKMRGFSSRVIVDTSLDISPSIATLMFKPIWKASLMDSEEALPIEITHRVFLCGLKQSSEELRFESVGMSFITLQSNQTLLEKRFVDYSLALFEHIQTLLAEKPKGPVLLQVVVPDQGPERMF